jgi:hypothetical protein
VQFATTTTLSKDLSVSTGTGAVTFTGAVDGAANLAVNSTGATTFTAAVGGTAALTSLTTNAGGTTAINGGAVTTTGAQTYNDNITISANSTLSSLGDRDVVLNGTVDGGYKLFVNTGGATIFYGAIGRATPLVSVTTDKPGTVNVVGGLVQTTGAQTYNEIMTLGADTTLTSLSGGDVTFGSTLDGAYKLIVNTSGATTFAGSVGGRTPLSSVTTDAPGTVILTGGAINTTGAQTLNELVDIQTFKFVLSSSNSSSGTADVGAASSPNMVISNNETKAEQYPIGELQVVNLMSSSNSQSTDSTAVRQISEAVVEKAVSQIATAGKSTLLTHLVVVEGGVRLGKGVAFSTVQGRPANPPKKKEGNQQ